MQNRILQASPSEGAQLAFAQRITHGIQRRSLHAARAQTQVAGSSFGHPPTVAVMLAGLEQELNRMLRGCFQRMGRLKGGHAERN